MDTQIEPKLYVAFSQFLEKSCGIVLGDSKQYLVKSRLTPLSKIAKSESINAYIDSIIKGNKQHQLDAIEAMTTNETLWFRDDYPFDLLRDSILSQFSEKKHPVRVWSAACSSGQEAYSIAMTISNFKKIRTNSFRSGIEIIGTDISQQMLQHCNTAEYDSLATSRGLPNQFQIDYFEAIDKDKLRLKPEVKNMAKFMSLNLLDSYGSLGKFDIVSWRNVLM